MDQERAHQINTNKKVVGCRNRMYKFLVATWKLHFCWSGTWVGALKDILIKHEVHLALSSICCAQPQEKNIVDIRWPCTADKAETWLHPKVPAGRNSLTRNGVSEGTWIYCFNLRSVHIYEFEAIKPYALPNDRSCLNLHYGCMCICHSPLPIVAINFWMLVSMYNFSFYHHCLAQCRSSSLLTQ